MSMITINKNPSARELNWFGVMFAGFFALIGALALWRSGSMPVAVVLWAIAVIVPAIYFAVPSCRRAIYLGWVYAAYPIGWVMSHVILGLVYYAVLTPIGLAMRLARYDPMQRSADPELSSYWIEHQPDSDPARYFRQF